MSPPRVALVTGATDGIGLQTALGLARAGARVLLHGRSRVKVEAALAEVRAAAPGADVEGLSFDLGSLAQVRRGAAAALERAPALDTLINNAGIFAPERVVTEDGLEATFAVNHVGPFLLTALLVPALRAAGAAAGRPARVVNVSSIAHTRGQIHLGDLQLERGWTGYVAYAQSKLANVMHARGLARRHAPDALEAFSLHPGVIGTKLLRQGFGPVRGATTAAGARTSIRLALAPAGEAPSGSYFSDDVLTPAGQAALDDAVAERLWAATAALAGLPADA